ncbi:MAG: hypothetical protein JNG85_17780, partial [Spirochaetaceae bacterium]|nr:hypothetical protein [Spirochaetaceae bacterium]
MRPSARLRVAAAAALFLGAGAWLAAQTPTPAPKGAAASDERELDAARAVVAVAVPSAGSGAAESLRFAEALAQSLAREAGATGLAAGRGDPIDYELAEPEAARGAARASGARWVFIARVSVESRRILWRAAAYDGRDGSLFGADAFSAYAGLSALPLLDASAKGVATQAAAARAAPERPVPIDYRLAFSSRDEGALVSFGLPGSEAFAAGAIAEGILEAPYLPFMPGERLV